MYFIAQIQVAQQYSSLTAQNNSMAVTRETLIHQTDCRWIPCVPSAHTVTDYLEVLRDLLGPPRKL